MTHCMNLWDDSFQAIKEGWKTVEMRLNDEKRSIIDVDDIIEFTNTTTQEKMSCKVMNIYKYSDFGELYKHHSKISIGYTEDETANPDDMLSYYTKEDIEKYGVVGIEVNKCYADACDWCNLCGEDKKYMLCKSNFWTILLADEQDYVGRCIVMLNRHASSLAELTSAEWNDFHTVIKNVEECLKNVLGADLCNWSCLMNSFFKEISPNPHVHWHVRPRYSKPLTINGNTYMDKSFGHHYVTGEQAIIANEDLQSVYQRMKDWFEKRGRI